MPLPRLGVVFLLPLVAAACSTTAPAPVAVPPAGSAASESAAASPPAAADAPARTCVLLQNIRETRVINDQTIDFYLRDGKVLRNTLPNRCPNLGVERAFTYATSITQLCNVDIITVINQGGGNMLGARCGLGKFTPYDPPPRR